MSVRDYHHAGWESAPDDDDRMFWEAGYRRGVQAVMCTACESERDYGGRCQSCPGQTGRCHDCHDTGWVLTAQEDMCNNAVLTPRRDQKFTFTRNSKEEEDR